MEVRWQARSPESAALPNEGGLPPLIRQIAANRGYASSEEIQSLVAPSLKTLKDPFLLRDMKQATARLTEAFLKDHPICLYGDFDLDGTSGLALLETGMRRLGFDSLRVYQPSRLSDGYGVHPASIHQLADEGVRVLVTVDVGTTAFEAIEAANSRGVDVIVTDHHLPKSELPAAFALVNPNAGGCSSGLGHLSGAGVAFYLVLALRRALANQGVVISGFDPKELLDCFVIGTLADMVPLKAENRVLVRHGLVQLAQTRRPALKSLVEALGLNERPLTSQDVAIQLAPKLNALSRMERGLSPLEIFRAEDATAANDLTTAVLLNNDIRKEVQREGEEQLLERLSKKPAQAFVWVWDERFHKGVVGLLATRAAEITGLPAFVGTVTKDNQIVGSARAPDGSSHSVLEALKASVGALIQFGGHSQAAGFRLHDHAAGELEKALGDYFRSCGSADPRVQWFDSQAEIQDINPELMAWLEKMEPFGKDFPPPIFLISKAQIREAKALRGGHLKLKLLQSGSEVAALLFGRSASEQGWESGMTVDILAEPQWNYFRGARTLQLLVRGIREHSAQI